MQCWYFTIFFVFLTKNWFFIKKNIWHLNGPSAEIAASVETIWILFCTAREEVVVLRATGAISEVGSKRDERSIYISSAAHQVPYPSPCLQFRPTLRPRDSGLYVCWKSYFIACSRFSNPEFIEYKVTFQQIYTLHQPEDEDQDSFWAKMTRLGHLRTSCRSLLCRNSLTPFRRLVPCWNSRQ